MNDAVTDFLASAAYHNCLLLVHTDVRKLETVADQLVMIYGWPRLSVGRELAPLLLSDSLVHRSLVACRSLETLLNRAAPGPVLVSEIDLLFEPTLQVDVLGLVRQASRMTKLLVAWPGTFEKGILAYAVPAHSHYRTWSRPEVNIVTLD